MSPESPGKSPIRRPDWAGRLFDIGRAMATIPNVTIGSASPRVFLSVPTGQYVAWMLAGGGLTAPPKLGPDPEMGDRVVTMLDRTVCETAVDGQPGGGWVLRYGSARKIGAAGSRPPGVVLPPDAPADRPVFQPNKPFIESIRPVHKISTREWYAEQSGSPVVVVGDGREHLHRQREELLKRVPTWLDSVPRELLRLEHRGMSDGERMLQFPYMILAPDVAAHHPWITGLAPRLVIYTRWSYFQKGLASGLFSKSPAVIIGNRRVDSNYDGIDFIESAAVEESAFAGIEIPPPISAMYAKGFTVEANETDDFGDDL